MTLTVQSTPAPRINLFTIKPGDHKTTITRMMRLVGVDPDNFEQVTSFLSRGTPEEVLMKLRMYTFSFFKQVEMKEQKSALEMFRAKVGDCADFAAFNIVVLQKAGISVTLFDLSQVKTLKECIGKILRGTLGVSNSEIATGHVFVVAESGTRLYRLDNHGIYYIGDRSNITNGDIINFVSFQLNNNHRGSRCRQLENTDLNTRQDVYSFLRLEKRAINASNGTRFKWIHAGSVRDVPFGPTEVAGYLRKNGSVETRIFGLDDIYTYYNSDMRETASHAAINMTSGAINYHLMFNDL